MGKLRENLIETEELARKKQMEDDGPQASYGYVHYRLFVNKRIRLNDKLMRKISAMVENSACKKIEWIIRPWVTITSAKLRSTRLKPTTVLGLVGSSAYKKITWIR